MKRERKHVHTEIRVASHRERSNKQQYLFLAWQPPTMVVSPCQIKNNGNIQASLLLSFSLLDMFCLLQNPSSFQHNPVSHTSHEQGQAMKRVKSFSSPYEKRGEWSFAST